VSRCVGTKWRRVLTLIRVCKSSSSSRRQGKHAPTSLLFSEKVCDLGITIAECSAQRVSLDLTKFRNASKALFLFLKKFSWSGKVDRLGFDEVSAEDFFWRVCLHVATVAFRYLCFGVDGGFRQGLQPRSLRIRSTARRRIRPWPNFRVLIGTRCRRISRRVLRTLILFMAVMLSHKTKEIVGFYGCLRHL
jgi:hypothetical protein